MMARTGRWLAALVALLLGAAGAASAQPLWQDFVKSDGPVAFEAVPQAGGAVMLEWRIAEGFYLYRDKLGASFEGRTLSLAAAPGEPKDDPTFGFTEVYHGRAEALLAAAALEELPADAVLDVTWQGCEDRGVCHAPVVRQLDLASLALLPDAPAAPVTSSAMTWRTAPDTGTGPAGPALVLAGKEDGMVASLLADGGVALLLVSFVVFGVALAFTPCVLPMYPILAGALSRAGEELSARRGFMLSSVYVVAMASAFGLLGVVAAWSGQNLQMALQSPWAVGAMAAVFTALALSMFGLFELRLPARWTTAVAGSAPSGRGTVASTAALGFTSALIVGPCVTAPLAGALLYIARTGDMVLGAAALFALGIGKGIPLIVFGTVGGRALPGRGRWMQAVNQAFGFVFLAAAVWMVSGLLAGPVALVLWSLLLIAAGVWLGVFDRLETSAGNGRRLGRTIGLAASLYGVILAVGAAAGAGDPLRPLAFLAPGGRAAVEQEPAFAPAASPAELHRALAVEDGRPALLYVTADWCVTCRIIERSVLPDPAVRQTLAGFRLIGVDVTENSPAQQAMMKELGVVGPPTMIFLDPARREAPGSRLVGEVSVRKLLASAGRAAES
ncbi:protein-disulfide reductase DsbD [Geminicoccaceae bacterium 1502E]|nr:protein-disulfide reductase DsbD [Geminicoccaceae bacterium 1502E]